MEFSVTVLDKPDDLMIGAKVARIFQKDYPTGRIGIRNCVVYAMTDNSYWVAYRTKSGSIKVQQN